MARTDDDLVDTALTTSSARLEPIIRFAEPTLTPYSQPSSALAARELALQRWDALSQHVRRVTFLAREVVNLARAEETLTGHPFGAPLEDPRAAHSFLPSAGARTFSVMPAFAAAYLDALEGVYLAAVPTAAPAAAPAAASPSLLGSSPPSSRAPTPVVTTASAEVGEPLAPQEVPARAGSDGDAAAVEDAVMADAV